MKSKNESSRSTASLAPLGDEALSAVSGGRATFTDLVIVKKTDKSSPTLFRKCATGTHLDEVTLTV